VRIRIHGVPLGSLTALQQNSSRHVHRNVPINPGHSMSPSNRGRGLPFPDESPTSLVTGYLRAISPKSRQVLARFASLIPVRPNPMVLKRLEVSKGICGKFGEMSLTTPSNHDQGNSGKYLQHFINSPPAHRWYAQIQSPATNSATSGANELPPT
jgi:hypothetical protein